MSLLHFLAVAFCVALLALLWVYKPTGWPLQSQISQQAKDAQPGAPSTAFMPPPAPKLLRNRAEQRLIASPDHAALLRDLEGLRDPDSLYLRALILDACNATQASRQKQTPAQRLQNFRDSTTGPHREQRIALFAHQQRNGAFIKCARLSTPITDKEVSDAFDAAAEAGSLHGHLDRIRRRLLEKALPSDMPVIGAPANFAGVRFYEGPGPSAEEAATLIQALASREPALIREAGIILSAKYSDYEIRLPDGKGIDQVPGYFVWEAVACHFAGGCGPESWAVQSNCIHQGRCDASSYNEVLQRHTLEPEKWNALVRHRDTLIRIIESGDFSQLNEARGRPQNFWKHQLPLVASPRFRVQP